MQFQEFHISGAFNSLEAVAEAFCHDIGGGFIHIDIDAAPAIDKKRAQIVDAMRLVGVMVGIHNAIEPVNVFAEKLVIEVG